MSKENICLWLTERKMIKQSDTHRSYSHHSSSDWTPIGHEATLSSHTTSQPPLTMATTSHDQLPWPATTDKPEPSVNLNTADFLSAGAETNWFKNSPN